MKHRAPEPEESTLDDVIHGRYRLSFRDQLFLGFVVVGLLFSVLVVVIVGIQKLLGWS